jgi:hypothetical protein
MDVSLTCECCIVMFWEMVYGAKKESIHRVKGTDIRKKYMLNKLEIVVWLKYQTVHITHAF